MSLTPSQTEAQNRIHDLLAELATLIGPDQDGQAEDRGSPVPDGSVFLNEWAIVAAWMDENGGTFTTRFGSASLPLHHLVGLLHEGLYGFG